MHAGMRAPLVLLWVMVLMLFVETVAAALEARLDRSRITDGETVLLMIRDDGQGGAAPDLAPLTSDFDILNQSQSSRMQMINGRTSSWREWQVVLAPKRLGKLSVPALSVGNAKTPTLSLEVLAADQAAKSGVPQPVMLEVEVTPESPYVQGKVVYTVRLLSQLPLRSPSLSDPASAGAIVERLGDERQYQASRNGANYRVIERRYAIFPQHSGALDIDGPVLNAQVPNPGNNANSPRDRFFGGRDPFAGFDRLLGNDPLADMGSMFAQTRPIRLRGRRVTLDVQPQPDGTPSPWIPAESLSLDETWAPNPPTFRVGEPVTRTIVMTAQGISSAQLPDLDLGGPAGVSMYPDKSQDSTRADGDTLVAQKVFKVALVPSVPGEVTLPPIELQWWDTAGNQLRTARLPARRLEVLPGGTGPATAPGNAVSSPGRGFAQPQAAPGPAPRTVAPESGPTGLAPPGGGARSYWAWLALLFAIAWLVTIWLWLTARSRRTREPVAVKAASVAVQDNVGRALKRLEQACHQNDAKAARQTLIDWARARWPEDPPNRLEAVTKRLPANAGATIRALDRALYAPGVTAWQGAASWKTLAPMLRAAAAKTDARKRDDTPLPPLYAQDQ